MHNPNVNAAAPDATTKAPDIATVVTSDLIVRIRPYNFEWWDYEGSRAQLEAEGVIPPNTTWPAGTESVCWQAGRHSYWLKRARPPGLKGPMRLWIRGDWWSLRCQLTNPPSDVQRFMVDKAREVAEMIHRHSPIGRRQFEREWARYWKARQDVAFQAFKAKFVPEQKKRGRKPKSAAGQCEAVHA